MFFIDAEKIQKHLVYQELVSALREIYATPNMKAHRHLHYMPELSDDSGVCMAAMPAWGPGHNIGTKVFTVFPNNKTEELPTVQAVVLVFDGKTGTPKAVVDGTELTLRRTASMSALATDLLARRDSYRLLVCGSGALAPHAALAHACVRPISHVEIWARRTEAAERVVNYLRTQRPDIQISVAENLEKAAGLADIVSCQTSAKDPFVFGKWIKPGTHIDLVGSHSPNARECDDELVAKSKVYVDVMETALQESGDIIIPMNNGSISRSDIHGDLSDLCGQRVPGRDTEQQITLYKSSGSALADLAAAELVVQKFEAATKSAELPNR